MFSGAFTEYGNLRIAEACASRASPINAKGGGSASALPRRASTLALTMEPLIIVRAGQGGGCGPLPVQHPSSAPAQQATRPSALQARYRWSNCNTDPRVSTARSSRRAVSRGEADRSKNFIVRSNAHNEWHLLLELKASTCSLSVLGVNA